MRKPINPPNIEQNNGEVLVQRTGLRLSTTDRIRQMVRHELFRQQANREAESFEEADDFDLPDGEDWVSPYENDFEPEPPYPPGDPAQDPSQPAAPLAAEPPPQPPAPARGDPNGQTPPAAP